MTADRRCGGMRHLLTVKEVAAVLREDTNRVLDRIAAGDLPAHNIGGMGRGARYRVDERDLDNFLESRRTGR